MCRPLVFNKSNHTLGRITTQSVSGLANIVVTVAANLGVTTVVKVITDFAIKVRAGINNVQSAQAAIYG